MGVTLIDYMNTTGSSIAEFITDNFSYCWDLSNLSEVAFQFPRIEDIFRSPSIVIELIVVIFVISITHFFDAVGTVTATTSMLQKEDINFNDQYMKRCIKTNGVGSIISACFGTSAVTIYAESTIGIMDGAKTGLCAIVVAVCMFFALILAPLVTAMTTFVMAPALIFIGCILIKHIKSIQRARPIEGLTSLIIFLYLGLTFKIAEAVLYGMLFYIVLMIARGKIKQLNRYSFLLLAFSVVYILLQLF
jgi:AGZA family xanthine/uracil permease-like MFS transporter